MTSTRQTRYKIATLEYVGSVGHATNADILAHLRNDVPVLSATTVHRVTSGLLANGELASAPPSLDNAARFDANLLEHDHFECKKCGCLRDINLPNDLLDNLRAVLGDCKFSGHLNIQGICGNCLQKEKNL
ncbi:MAG: transcriptional repressor [Candidatus Woesebacteria bacterium]|jgi:Fur family peroxide stress response transcriptional regulator